MGQQKVFWSNIKHRKVRHLWRKIYIPILDHYAIRSACGLQHSTTLEPSKGGDECKNCLRAIES